MKYLWLNRNLRNASVALLHPRLFALREDVNKRTGNAEA